MPKGGDVEIIQEAVGIAEGKTSAEFVVAIQPRSGSYRDVDLLAAAVVTALVMLFAFFGPAEVNPDFVPLNLLLTFGLVWLICSRIPQIRRGLTSEDRRKDQVQQAAGAFFLQYGVSQTRGRTGIIILVSQLERRVEVVADSGIHRAVDAEDWDKLLNEIQAGFNPENLPSTAVMAVERLGDYLKGPLPADPDDEDELTNVPHMHK